MAFIEKTKGKRDVTYRIIVSAGYDQNYKKIRRIKSWRPPEGMSEKWAEKEIQRLAYEFKTQIKQGYQIGNNKTFAEYAEYVIDLKKHDGIKPVTIRLYRYLLRQINST